MFSQNNVLDSLKLALKKTANKKSNSHTSLLIGEIYFNLNNLSDAQDYFNKSLVYSEQINDKKGKAEALNNIAIVHNKNGNLLKCIELLEQSLKIKIEINDSAGIGKAYNNLGFFYNIKRDTAKAFEYYIKALKLQEGSGDIAGEAYTLMNIGNLYKNRKEYNKTEEYYLKSLNLRKQIKDKKGITESLAGLGQMAYDQKDFTKAIIFSEESFKLSKEVGFPINIKISAELLYKIYKQKGNVSAALKMHELYTQIKDSLNSEKNRKSSVQKQFQLAYEKKAAADSVKTIESNKTEQIKHQLAISKQRSYTYGGIIGFILMLVVALISFKAFKQKHKDNQLISQQKQLVEFKQKEIIDSINYAKKIQDALLMHTDILNNTFTEHFILFKPKDIVSGDFYWATNKVTSTTFPAQSSDSAIKQPGLLNFKPEVSNSELFYLAVCDSTGHGVPGAFMSLLNISFLNEAVNEKNIFEPDKIFDYVKQRLIKSVSKEGQQDGFDGILLCIDAANKLLTYASANNRSLLIQNKSVIALPYNKMPVGKGDRNENFKLFRVAINKGDIIYMFSDGFADQFGGPKGKKFKSKKLEELLTTINELPMDSQSVILNQKFEEWKGSLEQVDDVCIIGIKI